MKPAMSIFWALLVVGGATCFGLAFSHTWALVLGGGSAFLLGGTKL